MNHFIQRCTRHRHRQDAVAAVAGHYHWKNRPSHTPTNYVPSPQKQCTGQRQYYHCNYQFQQYRHHQIPQQQMITDIGPYHHRRSRRRFADSSAQFSSSKGKGGNNNDSNGSSGDSTTLASTTTTASVAAVATTTSDNKKVTTLSIIAKKRRNQKITMVTAYDYPSAVHVDRAGIDVVLVGDSCAMVELGFETTLVSWMCILHGWCSFDTSSSSSSSHSNHVFVIMCSQSH
jgi:hypothetical protein